MREYKFRVWDKIHKCYLPIDSCGCFVWGELQCGIPAYREVLSGFELVFPSQTDKGSDYFGSMYSLFCGDDLVLEQWTGLKDENGKDVYEGDNVYFSISRTQHFQGAVVWSEKRCGWSVEITYEKVDAIEKVSPGYEHHRSKGNEWLSTLDSGCFDIKVLGNVHDEEAKQ